MKPIEKLTDEELVEECRRVFGLKPWKRGFPLHAAARGELERALRVAERIGQRKARAAYRLD
jgi:hypothetical protein